MDQGRRKFLLGLGIGALGLSIPEPWWEKFFKPKGRSMIAVPANYGEVIPASEEDLLDVITTISPHDSPLFQTFAAQSAVMVNMSWVDDCLEPFVDKHELLKRSLHVADTRRFLRS